MPIGVLEIQATPNPNAMKFVLDGTISSAPVRAYTLEEASSHPLAAGLMSIPGVTHVLLLGDFVTIGKRPEARWSDIKPKATKIIAKA